MARSQQALISLCLNYHLTRPYKGSTGKRLEQIRRLQVLQVQQAGGLAALLRTLTTMQVQWEDSLSKTAGFKTSHLMSSLTLTRVP